MTDRGIREGLRFIGEWVQSAGTLRARGGLITGYSIAALEDSHESVEANPICR